MKTVFSAIAISTLLSGCTTVVLTETNYTTTYRPVTNCFWVETPVYGYADVYRDGYNHIRIKEVAYVDRQRRCY